MLDTASQSLQTNLHIYYLKFASSIADYSEALNPVEVYTEWKIGCQPLDSQIHETVRNLD